MPTTGGENDSDTDLILYQITQEDQILIPEDSQIHPHAISGGSTIHKFNTLLVREPAAIKKGPEKRQNDPRNWRIIYTQTNLIK